MTSRLNWRRGLFRVWLFVTIFWVAFTGAVAIIAIIGVDDGLGISRVVRDGAALVLLPPLVMLSIGASAFWAVRGFKP